MQDAETARHEAKVNLGILYAATGKAGVATAAGRQRIG